LEVGDI